MAENIDPKNMTKTQRLALGLPPLDESPELTPEEEKKNMTNTRRIALGLPSMESPKTSTMTNTERMALGLSPIPVVRPPTESTRTPTGGIPVGRSSAESGERVSELDPNVKKSQTTRSTPSALSSITTQRFLAERQSTGSTQRLPTTSEAPVAGVYKPGQTNRIPAAQEKKRLKKLHLALILTLPTLIVLFVMLLLKGSDGEQLLDRKPEKFKDMLRANTDNGSASSSTSGPSAVPAKPIVETLKDGTVIRRERYSTGNIKVDLPLQHVESAPLPPPPEAAGIGGKRPDFVPDDALELERNRAYSGPKTKPQE